MYKYFQYQVSNACINLNCRIKKQDALWHPVLVNLYKIGLEYYFILHPSLMAGDTPGANMKVVVASPSSGETELIPRP